MTTPIDRVLHYQKSLEHYTNPGIDRLKRHWEFLISNTNDIVYFRTSVVTSVAIGACTGTTVGLKLSDGNRMAGVAAGLSGGIMGGVTYMTITERHKIYKTWINVKMDYIIDSAISIKYSDDPILCKFLCPIEQTMTFIPTRTPNGHFFDLNALMKCPKDENGNIKDPMRGPSFSPSALKFDHEIALIINKRMYDLIAVDMNAAGEARIVTEALARQLESTRNRIKTCYRGCLDIINDNLDNERVSFDESQEQRKLFAECFGKTPEHQLDWNQDWKDTLQIRWKAANPGCKIFG